MKLSLVLIVYRSESSIAQEASKFCEEVLKTKNINSKRIESDFYKDEIEKYFCNQELQPNIGIVLGGDGTFLKCANALADYDIPLLSINSMLIRTLTAFLLFNNPQIPIQNSAEDTIKNA